MSRIMKADRRHDREACLPEGLAAWCRIEDLSIACGYNADEQFGLLSELPDFYPGMPGQDPEDIAEEHPLQALAMMVRRFLAEYPETAGEMAAAVRKNNHTAKRPGMAA